MFQIEATTEIMHVNVRKQKAADDDRDLAIDVKCRAKGLDLEEIAPLLGTQPPAEIAAHLFDEGCPRFERLTDIDSDVEFKDALVVVAGYKLYTTVVRKFHVTLRPLGNVPAADLQFSFTLLNPKEEVLDYFASNLEEAVTMNVAQLQQELELDDALGENDERGDEEATEGAAA